MAVVPEAFDLIAAASAKHEQMTATRPKTFATTEKAVFFCVPPVIAARPSGSGVENC